MYVKNYFIFVKDSFWIFFEIYKVNEGFEI